MTGLAKFLAEDVPDVGGVGVRVRGGGGGDGVVGAVPGEVAIVLVTTFW